MLSELYVSQTFTFFFVPVDPVNFWCVTLEFGFLFFSAGLFIGKRNHGIIFPALVEGFGH
jgi:hypothetical protein